MKSTVLIYLILTFLSTVPNESVHLSLDDKEIDKAIAAEMSRFDIPSVVTCIIKNDTIVWEKTYGYANIEKKTPASLETIYPIASVSKLVTSVAVLQLS